MLAADALGAMASDPALFDRFLGETGVALAEIRTIAAQPDFLRGVLDFVVRHEDALTAVAAAANVPPERVVRAHERLAGRPAVGSE